jgi:cytochrome d ubiquinol oxidase subunit II
VVVSVLAGGVILFPALGLLLRLAVQGRFSSVEPAQSKAAAPGVRTVRSGLLARAAVACLIAGFGLLNVADASWAHAVGVVCFFAFVLLGFGAIVFPALRTGPTSH